jgi:16S rRNA (adenine1518-N6/adenine1519-N6)-dimethyltransferase
MKANKSLGQNFLIDANISRKIAQTAEICQADTLIEIGAGMGALTAQILDFKPSSVIVIEKDARFYEILERLPVSLVKNDALKIDYSTLPKGSKILGNLPYNVASDIILKILPVLSNFASLTIMVQKDFALKLIAKPDTSKYTVMSILVQSFADIKIHFHVPPQAFRPQPHVDSSVITIASRGEKADFYLFKSFLNILFSARRKPVLNTLQKHYKSTFTGIEKNLRPQNFTPCQLLKIFHAHADFQGEEVRTN